VKAKISGRTKMNIINAPHNTSWQLFSEGDMLQL
jgi:ligand-binding SRPBCC domain-containing protein